MLVGFIIGFVADGKIKERLIVFQDQFAYLTVFKKIYKHLARGAKLRPVACPYS